MGRRKKKETPVKKKQRTTGINIDLAVIVLFLISILLFILIYGEKGAIGEVLSPALGGIIGSIKYIIPIGFAAIAICVAKDDRSYITSKLVQYVVLLSCFAATMSIYQISKGTINMELEFNKIIEVAYNLGADYNVGGGTVGVVIAYPLIQLLGEFGAAVTTVGIVVVLCVFTFGLHPSELMLDFIDELNYRREAREEELNLRRERRQGKRDNLRKTQYEEEQNSKTPKNVQATFDDDDITINLNNKPLEEQLENEKKKSILDRFKKNKEEFNPEEIDANIYANLAKENEKESLKNSNSNKQNNSDNLFTVTDVEKEDNTKAVLTLGHGLTVVDERYEFPPTNILAKGKVSAKTATKTLTEKVSLLQKTLKNFNVSAKVEHISVGPAVTRYEVRPAEGVRVSKIANLSDDIALNLAAESIRIEAPIPGKQAVGIEIPNKEKENVALRDVLESEEFESSKSKLAIALGKGVDGVVIADIFKMPHLLIAGSTGSGKSVCINTLITSIIYKSKPSEVKMVMIDPKMVELSVYNGIPHLLIPVVTDPKKAAGALAWAVQEMENRYRLFSEKDVRDLAAYNNILEKEDLEEGQYGKLPQIVIIIDELADLMMVASKEVEESICRLAQKARAAGMHLVIATQRPSVNVITGLIKANIPSRIAFAVSSQVDSRTILDQMGAEKLLGKGDMLYYPVGVNKPTRVQGAFISDEEVKKVVSFIKANGVAQYSEEIAEAIENSNKTDGEIEKDNEDEEFDPFLMEAIDIAMGVGNMSASLLQRRFKIGYARAGRIIDQMEARGIISGYEGSKPRKVIMTKERWEELKMTTKPLESAEN